MTSLRIAIIADIHHGEDHFTKMGSTALPLLAEFRRFVADARPDLVVDVGDRISDRDHDTDLRLEREVAEIGTAYGEELLRSRSTTSAATTIATTSASPRTPPSSASRSSTRPSMSAAGGWCCGGRIR